MAPNLEDAFVFEVATPESSTNITPPSVSPVPSDSNSLSSLSSESDSGIHLDYSSLFLLERIRIPLEQNFRELLYKVTGTKNLETVTQVKLKVISHEVSLQHLCFHTPALTELILDGSIVSSLRDLGCGLKNLKILSLNRCGLSSLDGIFGLETLEEFYLADNIIADASHCSFLPDIKILDLRRNNLKDISAVSFLCMCPKLEHILLEGNEQIDKFPKYRQTIKGLLPNLKSLDGKSFTETECSADFSDVDENELEEYLKCSVDNVIAKECFLPPIASTTKQPDDNKDHPKNNDAKIKLARPKTALPSTAGKTELPSITNERKVISPSLLTSGAPICGNVAAALRRRQKTQEAWGETQA